MKPTLLLDLDNTLLQNDTKTFVPGYMQAWSDFIAPYLDPQRFLNAMMTSTRLMAEQPRPDCTLRQLFDSIFYPLIGMDKEKFLPLENQFYSQVFPTLKSLAQPIPGVTEFVKIAMEHDFQLAIATNPFFPLTAIEQRLSWANLPVDQYPFALVPNIESFHFGKPHVAFFAELLAYLGWPAGPVVMVGDDPKMDILPADQFGLPTFWITKEGATRPDDLQMPHAQGQLGDLLPWLDSLKDGPPEPDLTSLVSMVATLRSTPAVLGSLSQHLTAAHWNQHTRPGEWCLSDIVCHLRDVDIDVNIPRLKKILQEDNPFLPGMDTDRWIQERQYHLQDGSQALQSFIAARMNLLAVLDTLQPEGWQRTARHSIFGRTDLAELVSIIAGHDRLHIQQFQQDLKITSS
jgi:FMN phosphatase YigB (HAD superfamily)